MHKWTDAANQVYEQTREALQLVYDALNPGQQQKLMKDPAVKALFVRYEVRHD